MLILIFKSATQSSQTTSSFSQRPLLAPGPSPIQRRRVSYCILSNPSLCIEVRSLHSAPQGLEFLEARELRELGGGCSNLPSLRLKCVCICCKCCFSSIREPPPDRPKQHVPPVSLRTCTCVIMRACVHVHMSLCM